MAEYIKINANRKWTGYKNYGDIANMSLTDLAPGSRNVFVVDGKKLEVRAGMDYFGAPGEELTNTDPSWSLAGRIHSSYDDFVNNQGVKMPVRVFYSGTSAQGDIMDVWLPIYAGGVATSASQWYQITALSPTIPMTSNHEYYFAEWYDPLGKQNRLVFTYGAAGPSTNYVVSWTGGFANIVSLTGTTLTTDTTWREKGFAEPPEGPASVIINGIEMVVTSGDFSTNTIIVSSTAGIAIDDIAFQVFNFDTLPGTFVGDVCSTIKNQVYYEDWNERELLISWNRNQASEINPLVYEGTSGLNDAVITGTYTGTTDSTYKITIDSVAPNEQKFVGTGVNDASFDSSGYTDTDTNTYKVSIVADWSFTFVGTPSITPAVGDILVGGTSGAVGQVVFLDSGGQDPVLILRSEKGFQVGEAISGTQGAYGTVASSIGQAWVQTFKNGVAYTPSGFSSFVAYQFLVGTQLLIDGITFIVGTTNVGDNWATQTPGDYYELIVGANDTFSWSIDGVVISSSVPVSLAPTALNNGLFVAWQQVRGHDKGDSWTFTVHPKIIKGWREFYYAMPIRLPGQGFKVSLDSNGWAMAPQEDTMYVNAQAGHYYRIQSRLSADLQSETIQVERLKSEPQNKVLFPYLIGYIKNYLATISQDKTYDILGRQKFLELPQARAISDNVRIDFETADWQDASILYFKRKIYFSVPRIGLMFVWDDFNKYWHPPMKFGRRIGRLAIIDNKLCGHSYERNETYQLFVGVNDLGIYPIDTAMIFPYDGRNDRMAEKAVAAIGMEGYIIGNPEINWQINCNVGGCMGIPKGIVQPILCVPKDKASLGKSSHGYHGLGNDPETPSNYFNYIEVFPNALYYLRNMELRCNSIEQRWSIISIGTDIDQNNLNNSEITVRQI